MLFTHIYTSNVQAATLAAMQVLEDLAQTRELRLENFEVCVVF